jgi:hypothetical protein
MINNPSLAHADKVDNMRSLVGIVDGTSNVILAGHGQVAAGNYTTQTPAGTYFGSIYEGGKLWTARTTATHSRDPNTTTTVDTWGGPFPQGSLFVMADGTVRLFPYATALTNFLDSDDNNAV